MEIRKKIGELGQEKGAWYSLYPPLLGQLFEARELLPFDSFL